MSVRISGHVKLRPIRIGFLVRPTDGVSISRIMRWSTCMWGGRLNPIIPVGRFPESSRSSVKNLHRTERDISRAYMRFFEPDLLVEAESGLAEKIGYGALSQQPLDSHVITLDELHSKKWTGRNLDLYFGQSIMDVYIHEYETQRQFVLRDDTPNLLMDDKVERRIVESIFGAFPKESDAHYFESGYKQAYSPKTAKASPETLVSVFEGRARVPFFPTRHQLEITPRSRREPTFFYFDDRKPFDLIEYWNVRLYEDPVFPVPLRWWSSLRDYIHQSVDRFSPEKVDEGEVPTRNCKFMFAQSIPDASVKSIVDDLTDNCPPRSFYWQRSHHPEYRDDSFGPMESRHEVTADEQAIFVEAKDSSISFPLPYPKFAERYSGGRYRWSNPVNINTFGPTDLALCFPSNLEDRSLPRISVGSNGPIISREGWVFLGSYTKGSAYISLIKGQQAIIDWLKKLGIMASPSFAGRISAQMIEKLKLLQSADLIADKETIRLLNSMAMQDRLSGNGGASTVKTFEGRTADAGRWHEHIRKRQGDILRSRVTLDHFTKSEILRLGLGVQCPHCSHGNWYGLDEVSYIVSCERCLKQFDYPQGSKEARWKLRVVGPFSVPNFAEGGYAVTLALNFFARILNMSIDTSMTFSTGLDLKWSTFSGEVDFAFWFGRRRMLGEETEARFVVGEAKSFASESISQKDLDTLKSVASRLPGTVLVIAVLKDAFTTREKQLISKLVRWGWQSVNGRMRAPVILLSGTELFAKFSVVDAWNKAGPPFSENISYSDTADLERFSLATQRVYLQLDYYEFLRSRRRPKHYPPP